MHTLCFGPDSGEGQPLGPEFMDNGRLWWPGGHTEAVTWWSISIVLPAYNEEAVIARKVADCLAAAERFCPIFEVIVVDDGSRDRTGAIVDELAASDARVVALHHSLNRGYGTALRIGVSAARGELLSSWTAMGTSARRSWPTCCEYRKNTLISSCWAVGRGGAIRGCGASTPGAGNKPSEWPWASGAFAMLTAPSSSSPRTSSGPVYSTREERSSMPSCSRRCVVWVCR